MNLPRRAVLAGFLALATTVALAAPVAAVDLPDAPGPTTTTSVGAPAGTAPTTTTPSTPRPTTDPAPPTTSTTTPAEPVLIEAPFVDGEVIVKYATGTDPAERDATRSSVGGTDAAPLSELTPRTELVKLDGSKSVAEAVATLRADPDVRTAEPNYRVTSTLASNDPQYTGGSLWGMYGDATTPSNQYGSQAGEAWAVGRTGSANTYVVVVDEGIDVSHPDLVDNIWTNPFDPVNGIDDDGNGFVDDVHGWDFVNNDNSVYDAGGDSHGTHVSGTIGGVGGNGVGVAGVNWDVTIISGKFLGSGGGSTADAVRALDYATALKTRHGLNIVATSNSWGGGGFSQSLLDAINRGGDAGILFVAAAGNSNSNNDASGNYPSNYQCTRTAAGADRGWDCVVAVAAIGSGGERASFSSYGATTVDLGAPGVGVVSTTPGNTYSTYSGTSMATPHVSGAVALCASTNPALTAPQIRSALLSTTVATPSMTGTTVTGGRLDVGSLIATCQPAGAPVTGAPSGLTATALDDTSVRLNWVDGSTGESFQEVQRAVASPTCGTFATVGTVGADTTTTTVRSLTPSTAYCFRVRAGNVWGPGSTTSTTDWTDPATATTSAPPPLHTCGPTTYAWIDPGSHTTRSLTDDSSLTVPLGFGVNFLGATVTSVGVGSNGLLGFGSSPTAYVNQPIPNSSEPNGFAAPWWDDLDPGAGGSIRTATVGSAGSRRFVASWIDVPAYAAPGSGVTFQAIVEEETGAVVFQYLDTDAGSTARNGGASATIGTETPDGSRGTSVSYNTASVGNQTAIRCAVAVAPPAPVIGTTTLPEGTTGAGYSATLTATGGVTPYTWSLATGSLPAGITLAANGTLTGTPTAVGAASFTARVSGTGGGTAERSFTITVRAPLAVTTASLPGGVVGQSASTTLTATGGGTPYTWSLAAGSLPGGVTLSSAGVLAGSPTASGAFPVTVRVADPGGRSAQRALTLNVVDPLRITTTALPDATGQSAYSTTLAATGGTTPYTWARTAGSLPSGLSLAANGTVSGTPTANGSFTITVQVTDGAARTASSPVTLTVQTPTLALGSVRLTPSVNGSRRGATATVTVVDGKGTRVGSVKVTGTWTLPPTSPSNRTANTDGTGTATFVSPSYSGAAGKTLTFCVTGLSRSGYVSRLATVRNCASATL